MDQNISEKSEKEIRREKAELRSRIKKIIWSVSGVLLLGGLVYLSTRPQAPRPGEEFPILGQEHIEIGATHIEYNSNPPTSGPHYAQPAEWGVYDKELPDEQVIHNLEHGGIWISYKDVDGDTKSKLETLGKKYPRSVVVAPRSSNDKPVILASWGRLEKLESFDEDIIKTFIKRNMNKSPEPLASY